MGELRRDYILDEWVILSTGRQARPHQLIEDAKKDSQICYFCPGNEKLTPDENGRVSGKDGWLLRWVPNKFPAVESVGISFPKTDNRFFSFANNFGFHEIIIETPVHDKQMWDFSCGELESVLQVYSQRVSALESLQNIKYVTVFKNQGVHAGTSIVHAHSQIIAQSIIPSRVQQKLFAVRKFVECPYCAIVDAERHSNRFVFENNSVVAFTPYASRFNYEVWIFPKTHVTGLDQWNVLDVADALQHILARLKVLNCSFNILFTYAPRGTDLHLHCEICPRIATWAGYEFASGIVINSVSPEDAARFYRND